MDRKSRAKKFVPFEKLSKKDKREQNNRKRKLWEINPITRKPPSSRLYVRKKKADAKED